MGRTYRKRRKRLFNLEDNTSSDLIDYQKIHSLVQWLRDNGFDRRQKCGLKLSPNWFPMSGRGLQCRSKKISVGDLLVSIPHNLLVTRNTVLYSSDLPLNAKQTKLNSIDLLTAFLFWEQRKGSTSQWFHYIQSLPHTFEELPYLWPNLSEICSSVPKTLSDQLLSEFNRFESSMKKVFSELNICDKNDDNIRLFKWCYGVVNTRCVYLDTDDCPQDCALAPFLDLLNHSSNANVRVVSNKDNNCYEIYSLSEYFRYEEVFINYGNHNNRTLFTNYGFCCLNSDNNSIPLSSQLIFDLFSSLKTGSQVIPRMKCLSRIGFISEKPTTFWISCEAIDWRLETILKLLAISVWSEDSVIKSKIYSENIKLSKSERFVYLNLKSKLIERLLSEYNIENIYLFENNCLKSLLINEMSILSDLICSQYLK